MVHQIGAAHGANDRDVERAFQAAVESVRALPGSDVHFDQLVLSQARLYLYKKALHGIWPNGAALASGS
jgi:hypothetical protein